MTLFHVLWCVDGVRRVREFDGTEGVTMVDPAQHFNAVLLFCRGCRQLRKVDEAVDGAAIEPHLSFPPFPMRMIHCPGQVVDGCVPMAGGFNNILI